MKKKLTALVCALALVLSMAGCALSTPATVGRIGSFEVGSGLYLLAQYDAYQQAADLAGTEQDPADVKSFLKQSITVDTVNGTSAVVSDFVAEKTLENLESYAAVEARFEALGGSLTAEQEAQADSYAQQLMDQYGETYQANGIGLETLRRFERILLKSSALLDLVYGTEGAEQVSDEELTQHLRENMVELVYYAIPLYSVSTFAVASEEQTAQMLALAQDAADKVNAYAATCGDVSSAEASSAVLSYFSSTAGAALSDITAVMDSSTDGLSLQSELLGASTLDSVFTHENSAQVIRALDFGEAAAVQYSSYAMMLALRLDPLSLGDLDTLRARTLSDLKSEELKASLAAEGAALDHQLSAAAMKKMPASNIVHR